MHFVLAVLWTVDDIMFSYNGPMAHFMYSWDSGAQQP